MRTKAAYSFLAASTAILSPQQAAAQAVPEQDVGVADIVVTASKREERLQDVGISVAAIGGEQLESQRVQNIADLAKIVPGLNTTPSPGGVPVYTLRGVGFFESSLSGAPDVAVYLDQAPLALPVFSTLTAFDLERVEVLKGPQGTLFGSNATGGAINFVAAKPTSVLKAGIDLAYGRFNTLEVNAFVSGPLTDTLNARVAVKADRGDEWQKSYTIDDALGRKNNTAVRAIFDWRPTSRLNMTLNVNGWLNKSDPQAPQLARAVKPSDLQSPIGSTGYLGTVTSDIPILNYPAPPQNNRAADWLGAPYRPFADNKFFQATLNTVYNVTDDLDITSLTGYAYYKQRMAASLSGTTLADTDNGIDRGHASDFSQELRLSNNPRDRWRWVLGANYQRTSSYQYIANIYFDDTAFIVSGFSANGEDTRQTVRSLASFAHTEYDLLSNLTLKGGIRYTDTRHPIVSGTYGVPGYVEPNGGRGIINFVNAVFPTVYVPLVCPGVTFNPIGETDSWALNPDTCQSGKFETVFKEHNTSWNVGVDWKPADDVLLYAGISKGYKQGAAPIAAAVNQIQLQPVKQEFLTDYEVGLKATLFGGLATFDAAAFYYDYHDKQLRSLETDTLFGLLNRLVNIPKSRVMGLEGDLTARPTRDLRLTISGTYLSTKILDYTGVIGQTVDANGLHFPVYGDFRGVPLPFSPKFSGTVSVDYDFDIGSNLKGFLGASGHGQTKSYGSPAVTDVDDVTIKGYATLDLRSGIGSPDDKWKITFWGTNVTNTHYWTNRLRNYDTVVQYTGRPAEYGATISWRL